MTSLPTLTTDIDRLDIAVPALQRHFANLTRAHQFFQGDGNLKAVSVSDLFDDGSIDVTFHGVLVKFRLLYTYTVDGEPLGRVLVLHCHSSFGSPVQGQIGEFSLNEQGFSSLPPDADGKVANLGSDPALVVLTYLRKALAANAAVAG